MILQKPNLRLIFEDGTLRAEQLIKQIEMIHIQKLDGELYLTFVLRN